MAGGISLLALISFGCGRRHESSAGKPPKPDRHGQVIKAFFTSPIKKKGIFNGFWSVDSNDFKRFVEKKYLQDYKPLPNEWPAERIRANLANAGYFLRVEGLQCDELFLVEGGPQLVSPGQLKELERIRDRVIYQILIGRYDNQGKRTIDSAIVTAYRDRQELLFEFEDYKLRFHPETRSPTDLAEKYGKPSQATGLAEY